MPQSFTNSSPDEFITTAFLVCYLIKVLFCSDFHGMQPLNCLSISDVESDYDAHFFSGSNGIFAVGLAC